MDQWKKIIEHQSVLSCNEKGINYNALSQKEQLEIKLDIAIRLLSEFAK